jgi:hypothetical protein
MDRAKTFDASGIAPGGRLYAGDLNLIQDLAAALADFTQNLEAGTVAIGDSAIALSKFGTGEAQLGAALRVLGILRASGGVLPPSFTTTARNAIPAGFRPYGLVIVNTTTNRYEWNRGSDAVPDWQPIGPAVPVATADIADGAVTSLKIADGTIGAVDIADGVITEAKLAFTASRVLQRYRGAAGAPVASRFSSTTETDMFGTPSVGWQLLAGLLGTNRKIVITIEGDTGVGVTTWTPKIYYGGSAAVVGDDVRLVSSGVKQPFTMVIEIIALDATHQMIGGHVLEEAGSSGNTFTVIPNPSATGREAGIVNIDSTVDQNIRVTATNTANGSTIGWRVYSVDIELK